MHELERPAPTFPRMIVATTWTGVELQQQLLTDGLLDALATNNYGLALAMIDLSDARAAVMRQLNQHAVYTVAWLLLPPDEGYRLTLHNYPQAIEHYRAIHAWALEHDLQIDAVGLGIESLADDRGQIRNYGPGTLWERLQDEYEFYRNARMAYHDLADEIRRDGYEIHAYQLPLLADDRRAGTTLVQRALDVVDLPSDVEVLICSSRWTVEGLGRDLGAALISSYRSDTDSIGIGNTTGLLTLEQRYGQHHPLDWHVLERDLLLAARHTDIVYLFALESCLECGLLPRIAALDWQQEPDVPMRSMVVLETFRLSLLLVLLLARFYRGVLSWLGWILAAVLFAQQLYRWRRERVKRKA
ncbi:MAG: hypothetical protein HC837_21045 [Chloroflexaceae bacterium]|nr:hypothetical protein [Chloroflexaceae bacterium]